MKTRNLIRFSALALTLTMVTTSLVGGTLAKYTTTVQGVDTTTIARFGYEANDGADDVEFTTSSSVDLDLFDNLKTDATSTIADDSANSNDNTETNMMFAPGAYGSFDIQLDGTHSDVDIEMVGSKVTASAVNSNGNSITDEFISYTIIYNPSGISSETSATLASSYDVQRGSMADLASDLQTVLSGIILQKNTVGTITVQYAWVDGQDTEDTALIEQWQGYTVGGSADVSTTTMPTFTLAISNIASQIVTASPSYTTNVTHATTVAGGYTTVGTATSN